MSRRIRLLPAILLTCLFGLLGSIESAAATPDNWTYIDADGTIHNFGSSSACDNVADGGTIGFDVSGCANPTFQAPTLVNVTFPQGGTGDLEFLWMTTTTDPAGGAPVSWSVIPGSTTPDYTPAPLDQTSYFMRCARRNECTEYAGESNYVTVLIDCCDNATDGGTIAGDQTACGLPFDPSLITNSGAASGGSNAMQYAWYSSTTTNVFVPGSADWTEVVGVTTPYYDPSDVSGVTYFVRTASREFCGDIGAWSNVVTISAYPIPTLKADTTGVTCFGDADGTATITIIDAAAPFTYQWLDNGSTNLTRTGLAPGDYQFEISDANGCTTIEIVTIPEPTELTVTLTDSFDPCAFMDDAVITANAAGGSMPYTYLWNTGATTSEITNQPAGTYTVTVTDANGCTTNATVTVNPPLALTANTTVVQPVCYQNNGSITVNTSGGTAPLSFEWTPNIGIGATNVANNLPGGNYTIVVTDDNGCSVSVTATLDDTPDIVISLTPTPISCFSADDAAITSTVTGGVAPYTYSWNSGPTSEDLANLGPGTYELTVTDANGCDQQASVEIIEPLELTATISVVEPVCAEDGNTLSANITGGTAPYTWNWGTAGQNNITTLNNQPAGTYTLNVTDDAGCTTTTSVTVADIPVLELTSNSNDATCPGENDGDASVNITGGQAPYTILWDDLAAQTTTTALNLLGGTYTVTVTDARGCVKTASVLVDNQSTGPVITEDLVELDCFGGTDASIDLTISGGLAPYSFAWSDGPTTEDRVNLAAGTYEVTVTDAAGCENMASYTFVDPVEMTCTAIPVEKIINGTNYFHVSRFDGADGDANAVVMGGTAPYTYNWSNGSSGAAAAGLAGGNVSVTITDASGCTCTHDTTLVEPSMISDFVWEDTNGDGLQDLTETGLEGVDIRLTGRDFNNQQVNFSTTSAADGSYRFDQLPIGNYTMFFTLPQFQDYLFSPANQGGDDTVDSDMDPVNGIIRRQVTAHGVGDSDTDAGFIPRTSVVVISDKAWYDEDHDGIQDPFELEVQGVTLRLYRSADDLLVNTVVTNEDGEYFFNDVVPGTYYIEADQTTSSIGALFTFTKKDEGAIEGVDSDFDPLTGRTDDIEILSSTPDIDYIDLGLHENCDEIDTPGVIAGDEDVCVGNVPGPITSVSEPSNVANYQWFRSTSPNYRGSNDPNWSAINGATAATYQPSVIATTVYYIRLARTASCGVDFTGASNVIVKQAIQAPLAEISSATSSGGGTNNGNTLTMCDTELLTVSADNTSGGTYEWNFGPDATPQFASGTVVSDISFANVDAHRIYLSVTNAQGCVGLDSFQVNVITCFGPGDLGGLTARSDNGSNTVEWSALSLYTGSYFDIERSIDNQAFEVIESMDCIALGDWIDYSYEDRFAPSGEVTYRITHNAPSVESSISDEASVRVEQEALVTKVYPNPMSDELMVELVSASTGEIIYELINAYGQIVRLGKNNAGEHRLDVSMLPAGTYYLRATAPDGTQEMRTILKQ